MLWKPFSIFPAQKNSPVQHMGLLVGYTLYCACTARAGLWKPTCPRCHMQTAPRNQTRFPVGHSSEHHRNRNREKQSRLNFVCFVNHKAMCIRVLKAADTVDYKVGRPSLTPGKREGSHPAQSPAQSGEKAHFLNSILTFITAVMFSSPEAVILL